MPYPQNLEHKLEFDQIRTRLNDLCISPLGQQYVSQIRFTTKNDRVEMMLRQTHEFVSILSTDKPFT
jgi:DNA mismatch repair protein MutS2